MMMNEIIRVLVTCIGGGVGQSVIDSLKLRKDKYYIFGSDGNPFNYASCDCDSLIELPCISDQNYVETLLNAIATNSIDILVPGHDAELPLLAAATHLFEAAGCKVVVSDSRLVSLSRDKLEWSKHFRKYTDRVVASCSVEEARNGNGLVDIGYPAISKPRGGSASSGLVVLNSESDLEAVPDDYVIQPFLFPVQDDPDYASLKRSVDLGVISQVSEISVQLVFSYRGELLGRVATRNKLKDGVPIVIEPLDSALVWDAVDEICSVIQKFDPRGPINIQGRLTDNGMVFFELNPRFTGITGNRAQFGFNEVSLVIDNFVREEVRPLFFNCNRVGVRQVACLSRPRSEFFVPVEEKSRPRVLILGGSSWLGTNLLTRLARDGYRVAIISRSESFSRVSGHTALFDNVKVYADNDESIFDVIASSDIVVNCVSGRPPSGAGNIAESVSYQFKFLGLALDCGVSKIINISSQSVYCESGEPLVESSELELSNPYSFAKHVVESFLASSQLSASRVSIVSLRLGRLFGASTGMRDNEFPHRFVENAIAGQHIDIYAPGTLFDFLDIRDAVDAIMFFIEHENKFCSDIFNVGSGRVSTIKDFVDEATRVLDRELSVPLRINFHDGQDCRGRTLDISKINRLGWFPKHSLESSVRSLLRHYSRTN
jgi:nucleoside-diphosphate-sugar epimerase